MDGRKSRKDLLHDYIRKKKMLKDSMKTNSAIKSKPYIIEKEKENRVMQRPKPMTNTGQTNSSSSVLRIVDERIEEARIMGKHSVGGARQMFVDLLTQVPGASQLAVYWVARAKFERVCIIIVRMSFTNKIEYRIMGM